MKQLVIIAMTIVGLFSGCATPLSRDCPIDAEAVLKDCAVTNVTSATVFAWDPSDNPVSNIAIVGMRESKHVLILAYRWVNAKEPIQRKWTIPEAHLSFAEYCLSPRGEKEYDARPERADLLQLCDETLWDTNKYHWVLTATQAESQQDLGGYRH